MSNQQKLYKPGELIRDKRLTPLEQDYLALIACFELNGGCTASNNYFARFFGVSRTSATETITSLKQKGFIDSDNRKQGNQIIGRTIWVIDEGSRKHLLRGSRESRPGGGRKQPERVVGKPDTISKQISNNNTGAPRNSLCDETFGKFFEVYPRKENKVGALREWKKLKPDKVLTERIIEDVKRRSQTPDWLKDNGKYTPLPKNYLHDQRWEDELPENQLPTHEATEEELAAVMKEAG